MPMERDAGIVARFEPSSAPLDLPIEPEEIVARLFDPERRGELYPLYHQLRRVAPVHRTDDPHMRDVWLVSRFVDAMAVYRNPRAVSDPAMAEHFNHGGKNGPFYQLLKRMMLFLESGEHAQVRRITMKAFTARAIGQVRPVTEQLAGSLIDAVQARGEMDLVSEFAYELPIRVIAQLLGVPTADFPVIREFAYDFARGSELSPVETDRTRRADSAALAFRDYFEHLVARRRGDLQGDVLSALVAAEDEGKRLSHDDVVATAVLLMQAGHETTTDATGNAMVALFRHPDQLAILRDRRTVTKNSVEELVRYDSPNQVNNRLLLDDMDLGGVCLPAGSHVGVLIGAANRDPAQFPDPDVLQVARPTPPHVGFAFGAYYCLGNNLARTELDVGIRALLDRLPGLRPARDTFEWRNTLRNRGPQELKMAWDTTNA
jgi:pimeloyl-[acyl-carrier protein] synthase